VLFRSKEFNTPSKKFEFRSERGEKDGMGLFPHFTPPKEAIPKNKEDSFILLSPANKRLLNSIYAINEKFSHANASTITLNPADVIKMNLTLDSRVRVWNERGEFSALLKESGALKPGIAVSPKGLWPKFNGGSSINATVEERDADMAQGAVYSDNRVFISPLDN